jgi:co-chaperonin GroES (HSP10)
MDTRKKNLSKIELLGDRVVILLDEAQEHTITAGGIMVPLNSVYETDGGQLKTKTSAQKVLFKGTIEAISAHALTKLQESIPDIKIGDTVFVPQGTYSSHYYFYPERESLVLDFGGYVCIPHMMIEARYNG